MFQTKPLVRRIAAIGILCAVLISSADSRAEDASPLLLFEPASGKVLFAQNIDQQWFPASLAKLMTAYVTFEAIDEGKLTLQSELKISDHARAQPATRVGLRKGINITIDQAVRALIIRSANDFAVALAETVSGSEAAFIDRMNETARRLGMLRTNFTNPHGLPNPLQVSTARDMAMLTTALVRDFPQHADMFSNPEVSIRKLTLRSHNMMLRVYEGADGMKTGFTCASGYNIVASATREGRRVAVVVLGARTKHARTKSARDMLDKGFEQPLPDEAANKLTLASYPMSGSDSDDTVDFSRKTKTWVCGNAAKPRKLRKKGKRKKASSKKRRKKKSKRTRKKKK